MSKYCCEARPIQVPEVETSGETGREQPAEQEPEPSVCRATCPVRNDMDDDADSSCEICKGRTLLTSMRLHLHLHLHLHLRLSASASACLRDETG